MKKYFMKDTEDELQFGDMIELNLVKDEDGHRIHSHLECKFVPELIDTLLENDVIEVVEDEEEEGLEFADDDDSIIDDILEDIENIEKRLDTLEENIFTGTIYPYSSVFPKKWHVDIKEYFCKIG